MQPVNQQYFHTNSRILLFIENAAHLELENPDVNKEQTWSSGDYFKSKLLQITRVNYRSVIISVVFSLSSHIDVNPAAGGDITCPV